MGGVFDIPSFTFRLLANTAATGAAIEIMPTLDGEDAFDEPVFFDASGYYGMSFSYSTAPNPWGSTATLQGYDTYKVSLFVDFAFTAFTFTSPVCAADFGQQGGIAGHDGMLDNNDFIQFIDAFFATDPHADIGVQGGLQGSDGQFDNNDFIAFIDLYFAGC